MKFHSSHIKKRCLFPFVHFLNDFKQNISIWIASTYRWDLYGHFGVWKRWGNKTYQRTSKNPSSASWFVKKLNAWRSLIGTNILLKTAITLVCLYLCPRHSLEYHYNIVQKYFIKSAIPDHHAFFLSQGNLRMNRDQF